MGQRGRNFGNSSQINLAGQKLWKVVRDWPDKDGINGTAAELVFMCTVNEAPTTELWDSKAETLEISLRLIQQGKSFEK